MKVTKLTNRQLGLLQWAIRVASRVGLHTNKIGTAQHHKMVDDATNALMIIRAGNGQLSVTESQRLIQERDDAVAKLAKATDNVQEVHRNLQSAVWRIQDMLMGDDGQAFKEAQRFLERPAVAKLCAATAIPSCRVTVTATDISHLKVQSLGVAAMYEETKLFTLAGSKVDVSGGMITNRRLDPQTHEIVLTCHSDLTIRLGGRQ